MAKLEKWIEGIAAEDSVGMAARISLESRLAAVQSALPLAAKHSDEDIEHVHRLRVSARRTMAAMDLYRELLPKKQLKWFRKTLRRLQQTAGKARDLDVLVRDLVATAGNDARAILSEAARQRSKAQKPLLALHRKLKRDGMLRKRTKKLIAKIDADQGDGNEAGLLAWGILSLRKSAQRFFKAAPTDMQDLPSLHRFRIRGKELRYTIELLATAFPKGLREEIYPIIEQLQEYLGRIHDQMMAHDRLLAWSLERNGKARKLLAEKLATAKERKLRVELRKFARWWTPKLSTRLLRLFERLFKLAAK